MTDIEMPWWGVMLAALIVVGIIGWAAWQGGVRVDVRLAR